MTHTRSHRINDLARCNQQGATLAIVLIFLVLVTLVSVTALTTTTLEERMAGNLRDQNLAFQAAESALRDAKLDISGTVVPGAATSLKRSPALSGATGFGNSTSTLGTCSTTGLCLPTSLTYTAAALNNTLILTQSFTAAPSVQYGTYTGALPFANVALQPRYLIEAVRVCEGGGKCPSWMYRISARGYGARIETQVTLQEVYRP